ncbi:hypothetical protein [Aureitalea marina]|uniref:Gas vesicle protein n=1 Tax=Aureitalea marina TaxID=930804 RepID=A0A2S7KTJ8_9FLAO|nr:hypothetical protein [Aureitalea marina]PQB05916.1 hypothetical protein BST85_01940 [Aureitalea marina]
MTSQSDHKESTHTALALIAGALIGVGLGIYLANSDKDWGFDKIKSRLQGNDDEDTSQTEENKPSMKEEIKDTLDQVVSNLSYKADDLIVALEAKLAELKEKNAQFQK